MLTHKLNDILAKRRAKKVQLLLNSQEIILPANAKWVKPLGIQIRKRRRQTK